MRLADLTARGLTDIQQEITGDLPRQLSIKDPSGSTLSYIQRAQRSLEEILARYARGGEEVSAPQAIL